MKILGKEGFIKTNVGKIDSQNELTVNNKNISNSNDILENKLFWELILIVHKLSYWYCRNTGTKARGSLGVKTLHVTLSNRIQKHRYRILNQNHVIFIPFLQSYINIPKVVNVTCHTTYRTEEKNQAGISVPAYKTRRIHTLHFIKMFSKLSIGRNFRMRNIYK